MAMLEEQRTKDRVAGLEAVGGTDDERGEEMPWFSKKKAATLNAPEPIVPAHNVPEQSVAAGNMPAQSAPQVRRSVQLPDLGRPAKDARQLVHGLLEGCGLSILLMGPRPIEAVLGEAVHRAPELANSSPLGSGIMRLNADANTPWVALESPSGSAVVVFGLPDSDTNLIMRKIMNPFGMSTAPFTREVITRGSAEEPVAELLDGYEVVAVSEFPPFQHLAACQRLLSTADIGPSRCPTLEPTWGRPLQDDSQGHG